MKDRMSPAEKTALSLAMAAQAFMVAQWYLGPHTNPALMTAISALYVIFAICAGVSLDLVVVITTIGRRDGRQSYWSHATAFGASLFSAAIAYDAYNPAVDYGAVLNVAWAVVVFLFIQHLSVHRRSDVAELYTASRREIAALREELTAASAALVEASNQQTALAAEIAALAETNAVLQETVESESKEYSPRTMAPLLKAAGLSVREIASVFNLAHTTVQTWLK